MYNKITLSSLFNNSKDIDDLLKTLKKHQDDGVKYILSYGFGEIGIQNCINSIETLKKNMLDLEEIYRAINYQIHS